MNIFIILGVIAVIAFIIFLIYRFTTKKNEIDNKLFGEGGAVAANKVAMYNFWLASKNDKIKLFGDNINVSDQEKIFDSNPLIGRNSNMHNDVFDRIISQAAKKVNLKLNKKQKERAMKEVIEDKGVLEKMKSAESKKDKEKILERWMKERYGKKKTQEIERKKSEGDDPKKIIAKKKRSITVSSSPVIFSKKKGKGDGKASKNKTKSKKYKKGSNQLENKQKPIRLTREEKKVKKVQKMYDNLVKYLNSGKIDKLIDLIRSLKDKDVEDLIKYYGQIKFNPKEKNKIDIILEKARSKKDMIGLIKTEVVNNIKLKFDELKLKLSIVRKRGHDVRHEELKLMTVPSKIKIFEATFKKEDFVTAEKIILEIDTSLDFIAPDLQKKGGMIDGKEEKKNSKKRKQEKK